MRTMISSGFGLVHAPGFEFAELKTVLVGELKKTTPINRGRWQSEDVSQSDAHAAHELANLTVVTTIPGEVRNAQRYFRPDLPWAENHFQERVSGQPLNPAPSYRDWPYHSASERDRFVREGGAFDHTYPERFWPKRANPGEVMQFQSGRSAEVNVGIRFAYGDLLDVVELLHKDPFTRQAYLPVFFPEDTGAVDGQRVPCTLGYHFIRRGAALDCNYLMRSCDMYRHFSNDVYMAARLTQWIVDQITTEGALVWTGNLTMFISNLHLFRGDVWRFDPAGTTS
jgi:hypothetical protein